MVHAPRKKRERSADRLPGSNDLYLGSKSAWTHTNSTSNTLLRLFVVSESPNLAISLGYTSQTVNETWIDAIPFLFVLHATEGKETIFH